MAQKLDIKSWMISAGTLWGTYLFLAALLNMTGLNYYWFSASTFELLQSIYPGLSATIPGAFLGLIHGAICGVICAGLFSWVHNLAQSCWCSK